MGQQGWSKQTQISLESIENDHCFTGKTGSSQRREVEAWLLVGTVEENRKMLYYIIKKANQHVWKQVKAIKTKQPRVCT